MDPNQNQPNDNQPQAPATQEWSQPVTPESKSVPEIQPVASAQPEPYIQPAPQPVIEPQPAAPQPAPAGSTSSKGLAIASMVVGIVAMITGPLGILLGVIAIILGIISLKKQPDGKGFSIAGIILGALSIIGGIIITLTAIAIINGIQDSGAATVNYNQASDISKVASKYNADHMTADDSFAYHYPTFDQLVAESGMSELKNNVHAGGASSVTKDKPIAYESCNEGGTIYYYAGSRGVKSFPAGFPEKC